MGAGQFWWLLVEAGKGHTDRGERTEGIRRVLVRERGRLTRRSAGGTAQDARRSTVVTPRKTVRPVFPTSLLAKLLPGAAKGKQRWLCRAVGAGKKQWLWRILEPSVEVRG